MAQREGGCLCGQVRYTLKSEPVVIAVCHCTHCQKQSGAMFSTNLGLPEAGGDRTAFERCQPVLRCFCGECGSPILSKVGAMPGFVLIKAGTLDDLSGLKPALEVYTDHAADWVPKLSITPSFAQGT